MSKKDRLRFLTTGLVYRNGKLIPSHLVKKVESVMQDKQGVIDKLVDTWKRDMRKEIKDKGLSYLTEFDLEKQLKENMDTIQSNFTLRTMARSINLTEEDVRNAMERTLADMRIEYKIDDKPHSF